VPIYSPIIAESPATLPQQESLFAWLLNPFFDSIGQHRSFGDVGSMSGLPKSGHGWNAARKEER
jgi:hypothetical protein